MEAVMMRCLAGQFLDKSIDDCSPCPDGTYNSAPGNNARCEPCTRGCHLSLREVFQYGCNSTHDLFCACVEGYTRSLSNKKRCIAKKVYDFKKNAMSSNLTSWEQAVYNFTEDNDIPFNFTTMEQAATSAPTNTSAATHPICHWTPWLPAWTCFSPAAVVIFCFLLAGLLIFFYRHKKLQTKCQQPKAVVMLDFEQHQEKVPDEKNKLLGDEENGNSMVNDARISLPQFNSGGSGHASTPESCPSVYRPDSVRFMEYDPSGSERKEPLPLSSLCAEQESSRLSLNLIEDEDPTPIKKVAEGTRYIT